LAADNSCTLAQLLQQHLVILKVSGVASSVKQP
jgi:hypothetical protein